MRKKIISVMLVFILTFTCAACNISAPQNSNGENAADTAQPQSTDSSFELEVLKADYHYTPEEKLAQIKSEYLIKNNGYSDDDQVVVSLVLNDDSLMDTYLGEDFNSSAKSVGEFAASDDGVRIARKLAAKQEKLINSLYNRGLITGVKYTYKTITNAVAVETTYGNFRKIEEQLVGSQIKQAVLSDTYSRPQTMTVGSGSLVENDVNVYATGIYDSSTVPYTGKKTAVAILDSGFDTSHSVFTQYELDPDQLLLTRSDIQGVITQKEDVLNAVETTPGLIVDNVYYSDKIPFAYDYADKDYDVFPYDSEHGTHVAGIIGGHDDKITGVAVDTQLVLMKVFADLESGAKQEDILAALEDAVILNVDAINMSLGISCGFARESDADFTNQIYDSIGEAGISLITAASNDYSSAYGGEQGNTSFVTNPDNGTVGSPSTYGAALSVASISGKPSKYIESDGNIIYFHESSAISGKENDFFAELYAQLQKDPGETLELEYVTVPGVGNRGNYNNINVKGKIALVRRGDNSFEDKALQAKSNGAVACIIYNNIEGDILMSMGKSDHIPTISISKDAGTLLAAKDSGVVKISYSNQAGPFMSDFSSWGPMPDLELKPEITAHGGNIMSSVPGGDYEELSGTSMASPNMCGVVVLIRQYLKEKYPALGWQEISKMTNQILMSTATIILNEEGNPYSPRKQGAGLASLFNTVNTKGYITVDGKDRSKIELGDDPQRKGVYEMDFNVVNMSGDILKYDLSMTAMSESVSTSDITHIAEKGYLLSDNFVATVKGNGSFSGKTLTVAGGGTAKVHLTYSLTDSDKDYIESHFPYGQYVEGFINLNLASDGDDNPDNNVSLNVPFLAFYGDWTQAPMFDKTYYEVESEAHNQGIDEEDKIKADYYATTPYGTYFNNYIIPLGSYVYTVDTSMYDEVPASLDHIAISDDHSAIDGISTVYTGLLRNAKYMYYTITDKDSGEVIWRFTDENVYKAHGSGGTPIPSYEFLRLAAADLNLITNREYTFRMEARLDYKLEYDEQGNVIGGGGETTNVRNSFEFDFTFDNQAPVLRGATFEKIYDKTLKKDRFYINLNVYDNHYVMSVYPMIFNKESGNYVQQSYLTAHPIPVESDKGKDNIVRFEITDMLNDARFADYMDGYLAFSVDDYAMNTNFYFVRLPGSNGALKFTSNGAADGEDLNVVTVKPGEVLDLTQYLVSTDQTSYKDKDFLTSLSWASSDEGTAVAAEGQVMGVKPGFARVTVTSGLIGATAQIMVRVSAAATTSAGRNGLKISPVADRNVENVENSRIESVRFAYFTTLFAHLSSGDYSQIGEAGDFHFVNGVGGGVEMYPLESIQLFYDVEPWYVKDKYNAIFTSTNPAVAEVDEVTGVVKAKSEGNARIIVQFGTKDENGNIIPQTTLQARFSITVKSEFVIENRTLQAYKGVGGDVVIPDDEGILYIGPYAFSQYTTDPDIPVDENDWYANYTAGENNTITSVTIPKGVMEIQRNAFENCLKLETVTIDDPDGDLKFIREFAFRNCEMLQSINLEKVQAIGSQAFEGTALKNVDLSKCYAMGVGAFANSALQSVDISHLRNAGRETFAGCTDLTQVTLDPNGNTKLSEGMFLNSGLTQISVINTKTGIPAYCFYGCKKLKAPVIDTPESASQMGSYAFYGCTSLSEITLPDHTVSYGTQVFGGCTSLTTVKLRKNTLIQDAPMLFAGTGVTGFEFVDGSNQNYSLANSGKYLMNSAGTTLILAAPANDYGSISLDYAVIGNSAFSGANVTGVTFTAANVQIGDYAFANCPQLTSVSFAAKPGARVGAYAFAAFGNDGRITTSALTSVDNLQNVQYFGSGSFAGLKLENVNIGSGAELAYGAFVYSQIKTLTLGKDVSIGEGAFGYCDMLTTVTMPAEGGVTMGDNAFYGCTALESIDLSLVEEIPEGAFYDCESLAGIDLSSAVSVGNYSFANCMSLATVSNVEKLVTIGDYAFQGAVFTQISLPTTLRSIGQYAFRGNALNTITLPEGLQSLGEYAFAQSALRTVVLPQSLKTLGDFAFSGVANLTTINLENVEVFGNNVFASALSLNAADLSSALTVGDFAFSGTAALKNVNAPKLQSVGEYAFSGSGLTQFAAPNLADIGSYAFASTGLTQFTFSDKFASIGSAVFYESNNLAKFLTKDNTEEGEISPFAKLINGALYTLMLNGRQQFTAIPAAKTFENGLFEVAEGTYRIALSAANGNKNIEKLVLPDSLKAIENFAFYDCTNLKTVEFRSVVAPVLENYAVAMDSTLSPLDPGYEDLHGAFEFSNMVTTVYNYNFVDLVGKNEPLGIIVPANSDIEGYDSLLYKMYFGEVTAAERSGYVAMEKNMRLFLEYAARVSDLTAVTLNDETLVMNAATAYNAIKKLNYADYGVGEEEWAALVECVNQAKAKISEIKKSNMTRVGKDIQARIDALPDSYNGEADVESAYLQLTDDINSLRLKTDIDALDLTKYNLFKASYDTYKSAQGNPGKDPSDPDIDPLPGDENQGMPAWAIALICVGGALVLCGAAVAVVLILKKRKAATPAQNTQTPEEQGADGSEPQADGSETAQADGSEPAQADGNPEDNQNSGNADSAD